MNILLKQFILGFVVETLASFDDMLTTVPLMIAATRSRLGKVLFAIGSMLGIAVVALLAAFFAPLIAQIPYSRYIVVGLIFLMAAMVYFRQLAKLFKGGARVVDKLAARKMDMDRFLILFTVGFITSFFTLIDDAVAFIPLFVENHTKAWAAGAGIMLSGLLQTIALIYLAEQIERFKYRRQVTTAGLLLYGFLVLFEVI